MPKEFQASITIAKPLEDTFNFTSDVNNLPLWSGASAVEVVVENPLKIGSEYKVTFTSLLKKTNILIRITEYRAPYFWAFKTQEPPVATSSYIFENVEEGTKVTLNYTQEQDPSLLADMAIKRKMEKLLANLRNTLQVHNADTRLRRGFGGQA